MRKTDSPPEQGPWRNRVHVDGADRHRRMGLRLEKDFYSKPNNTGNKTFSEHFCKKQNYAACCSHAQGCVSKVLVTTVGAEEQNVG